MIELFFDLPLRMIVELASPDAKALVCPLYWLELAKTGQNYQA